MLSESQRQVQKSFLKQQFMKADAGQYSKNVMGLVGNLRSIFRAYDRETAGGLSLKIVIDTIAKDGGCRARIVEILRCEGGVLFVRENSRQDQIALDQIVDWAPIEIGEIAKFPVHEWIPRRDPGFVCF